MEAKKEEIIESLRCLANGIPVDPLPGHKTRDGNIPHAPPLNTNMTDEEVKLAIRNALRYFPPETHKLLASEFRHELLTYGHIYMYRFVPKTFVMKSYPIDYYESFTKCSEAAAIMSMIMNNLDHRVAQFPEELVTYGTNGQVFSNWAQFWLLMKYLSMLETDQTISMYSGHPAGLFPSVPNAPRLVITNGMMIPNYSSPSDYNRLFGLGVTMYGQMTAGSYCYIGPQGIVHGTVLTLLNAARKYLNTSDLTGKIFLTSGLGGMSGAQAKAAVICNCIGIIAEVNENAIKKRHSQGWVDMIIDDADNLIQKVIELKQKKQSVSIAYYGNIVTLWQKFYQHLEKTGINLIDLASDQTSCHNVSSGGYYPVGISLESANELIKSDPETFKKHVKESLVTHVKYINLMCDKGTRFWDYGNAFLLEAHRAGADLNANQTPAGLTFKYPSYVQLVMGHIFSLGFGPFRWVCLSQSIADLKKTDEIAVEIMSMILENEKDGELLPPDVQSQYRDNIYWIKSCTVKHNLVVGSCARILYADQMGRSLIALAFNKAIRNGKLSAPVVVSRDHHDVSGTDSPFRETSDVTDGSRVTADMSVQNFAGTAVRGATWVAIHNGGGVGWGEVINGGFGLVLDGSVETDARIRAVLGFDVSNGVTRRSWAGNMDAKKTIIRTMSLDPKLVATVPFDVASDF